MPFIAAQVSPGPVLNRGLTYELVMSSFEYGKDDDEQLDEKPDFLPMFPWYSGTSADMYRTMFDLLISLKLFLGRYDMRQMQVCTSCCASVNECFVHRSSYLLQLNRINPSLRLYSDRPGSIAVKVLWMSHLPASDSSNGIVQFS